MTTPNAATWKLLNPGPVTLTSRVRDALLQPDLCHREPEFTALIDDVRARLLEVDPAVAGCIPLVLAGSGTAAVEAMVQTFVPKADQHEGHAVVVDNGVYGARMAAMLTASGKRVQVVKSEWAEGIDLDAVAAVLPGATALLAVHHETTTGRKNDVDGLARLCAQHGVPLLLDAVSSFGAEPLPRVPGLVAAYASTANKCLHGITGACFVLADPQLFERPSGAVSVYFDLHRYRAPGASSAQAGATPFTPAVHSLYALRAAIAEFTEAGGRAARFARYARHSAQVRSALERAGYRALLPASSSSVCLQTFWLKAGVGYDVVHDRLKERGFVIYAGQGPLASRTLRIAVMGDLDDADIDRLTTALSEIA